MLWHLSRLDVSVQGVCTVGGVCEEGSTKTFPCRVTRADSFLQIALLKGCPLPPSVSVHLLASKNQFPLFRKGTGKYFSASLEGSERPNVFHFLSATSLFPIVKEKILQIRNFLGASLQRVLIQPAVPRCQLIFIRCIQPLLRWTTGLLVHGKPEREKLKAHN